MPDKKFVDVTAEHSRDGKVKPLSITWEDGRVYSVGRVLDQGMRYTCRIHGKEVYLFCDSGQWFIES